MNGVLKLATGLVIAAAGGLFLGMAPARAGDLGGNCCADLDERVAELEATTARKGNRKVSLVISGQINRSFLWYDDGDRSRVLSVDNAMSNSRLRAVGNGRISPSLQVGFVLEMDLAIGARSHQVSQVDDDGAGAPLTAMGDGIGVAGDGLLGFTLANWYVVHKEYGQITLGRLNTATSGVSIVDLGGIGVIASGQAYLWGGGFILRNGASVLSNTGGPTPVPGATWSSLSCGANAGGIAGNTFGGAYAADCGFNSLSRRDAIRYDTPTLYGFSGAVAYGEDWFWDVALRYADEFQGLRVAGAIGFRHFRDREPDALNAGNTGPIGDSHREQWLGSASILHVASGVFINGAFYQYQYKGTNIGEVISGTSVNRPDTKFWYLAGGISQNWLGVGKTALYAEFGRTTDGITGLDAGNVALPGLGASGTVVASEMKFWGLGMVQNVDSAALELYLAYRKYEASVVTSGTQVTGGLKDIDFVQTGARIQF